MRQNSIKLHSVGFWKCIRLLNTVLSSRTFKKSNVVKKPRKTLQYFLHAPNPSVAPPAPIIGVLHIWGATLNPHPLFGHFSQIKNYLMEFNYINTFKVLQKHLGKGWTPLPPSGQCPYLDRFFFKDMAPLVLPSKNRLHELCFLQKLSVLIDTGCFVI